MNASTAVAKESPPLTLSKIDTSTPVFLLMGDQLMIKPGSKIAFGALSAEFADGATVALPELVAGQDLEIVLNPDGTLSAVPHGTDASGAVVGGFHYAPGGNATGRAGGDAVPAINPNSIWDVRFRPTCPDPRGMAYVADVRGAGTEKPFWADIYLLGANHLEDGTSRFGVTIADDNDRPVKLTGKGKFDDLNWHTATAIMAHHGKSLPSVAEFFALAFGVKERTARGKDPKVTGLDVLRTSAAGIMQATGSMWTWGHDGDSDEPRACLFGGAWMTGASAGSRQAYVDSWADDSGGHFGARGRSDHLMLD